MNEQLKIQIIIGSTRQNRFSEKPANYLFEELKKREDAQAELIDLRDWPLPFFDEPMGPSGNKGMYVNPLGKQWANKIGEADGYIMITPEYNHGYPAVLKNAIDWVGPEWHKKPVGFVSYGSALGSRAIEQLRQVVIELRMVPLFSSIHIPTEVLMTVRAEKAPVDPAHFQPLREGRAGDRVERFFNELIEYAKMLKVMRS